MARSRLTAGDFGEEVTRLHERLAAHGVNVSEEERKRRFFGPSTREAVGEFQKAHGIDPTYEVGEQTEVFLEREPAAPAEARSSIRRLPQSPAVTSETERIPEAHTEQSPPPTSAASSPPEARPVAGRVATATTEAVATEAPEAHPVPKRTLSKSELLVLERLSHLSPKELKTENPQLFARLQELSTSQIRDSLAAHFTTSAQELRETIAAIDLSAIVDRNEDVRRVLRDTLRATEMTPALAQDAEARIAALERSGVPLNPLDMDVPLKNHPLVHSELQQAKLHLLGDVMGLSQAKVERVLSRSPGVIALNDAALESLVQAGDIQASEARELGLTTNLYQLVDENIQLTETLKKGRFAPLGERNITAIRDLVAFADDDWLSLLQRAAVAPPNGMTAVDYAALLRKRVATLYPSDALHARLQPMEARTITSGLQRVQPLLARNASAFRSKNFESLNTDGVAGTELEALRTTYTQLQRFANTHHGLRLAEVLDDSSLSAADKANRITERLNLVTRVHQQNPNVELLALDYSPDSADVTALNVVGLSDSEQRMVIANLKARQRPYALTGDVDHAKAMLEAGYHSASSIMQDGFSTFMQSTGFDQAVAYNHYQAASNMVATVATGVGAVLDLYSGFSMLNVANLDSSIDNYLKKLDGYADLFGSQTYCLCQHCQSILSPAAYFVDLMRFVEEKVLEPTFATKLDHPLNLKVRRPDLWTLELTCDNTNTLVPSLDLINEILENYIATDLVKGTAQSVNVSDRKAVEKTVYQALSTAKHSFQQPFVLPLEKLQIYLAHFNRTRADIARLLSKDAAVVARAALKLSDSEYTLITQENTTQAFLQKLYHGVPFQLQPGGNQLEPFDVQLLLKPMGVSRTELGELVNTNFVKSGLRQDMSIVAGKRDEKESVQNDIERISHLTLGRLDRMHRFTRLWRRVPWSISELDLVLASLGDTNLDKVDDIATVLHMQETLDVSVEALCALWSEIPRVVLAGTKQSLFERLFNRPPFLQLGELAVDTRATFTHPSFLCPASQPPQSNARAAADNALASRLCAGLNVSDEELLQLITRLDKPLGLNLNAANPKDRNYSFELNLNNLTLLYRHALLAKRLKLTIPDLFRLITYAGIADGYVHELTHLPRVLDFHAWWKTAGYSLDDLAFVTTGKAEKPITDVDSQKIVTEILAEVKTGKALEFADTVFAFLDDVTEELSRRSIQENSASFIITDQSLEKLKSAKVPQDIREKLKDIKDQVVLGEEQFLEKLKSTIGEEQTIGYKSLILENSKPDHAIVNIIQETIGDKTVYRLSKAFRTDTPFIIPHSVIVAVAKAKGQPDEQQVKSSLETEARAILLKYHANEVIPTRLAAKLKLPVDKTKALMAMTRISLDDEAFTLALQGDSSSAAKLVELVEKVLPLTVLFRKSIFDAQALDFLHKNTVLFSIDDFTKISVEHIRTLSIYAAIADTSEESKFSVQEPDFEPDDVRKVLWVLHETLKPAQPLALKPAQPRPLTEDARKLLARVLRVEAGLASTLLALPLPNSAPEALQTLVRYAELATYLGVSGETLMHIIADDYDKLALASDALLGAFRAKYADEKEWKEKNDPFEDRIRARKRDALTDYLLHSGYPQFETLNDLYHYFLVDVELTGCARTSRVVAAISSVQLYVHRVLMNLEQDQRAPTDSNHLHIQPTSIPAKEWVWRKNYRVWEANRKVFLYPENYIEPELRDDKTPLFEELESTLLQQEINEQNVLDAYASYMTSFEEVARLKIAGAYHDIRHDKNGKPDAQAMEDTLHLFGVTPGDPPTYYYRSVDYAYWGEKEPNKKAVVWNPWRKIDVQIPVRKVAPVVFRGRLYVFWGEITTSPKNDELKGGTSKFVGYKHKLSLQYTILRLDDTWAAPQHIAILEGPPFVGQGVIFDYFTKHSEPMDGYTLGGFLWEQLYPVIEDNKYLDIILAGIEQQAAIDYSKKIALFRPIKIGGQTYWSRVLHAKSGNGRDLELYTIGIRQWSISGEYAFRSIAVDQRNFEEAIHYNVHWFGLEQDLKKPLRMMLLAKLNSDDNLTIINGSVEDCIIDSKGDLLLLQGSIHDLVYVIKRLGTTINETLSEKLFTNGVDAFLDIQFQHDYLKEAKLPITLVEPVTHLLLVSDKSNAGKLDFTGPYGVYYREIFFHIPFLIANHLNSQGKFDSAQRWYHYIFNPTAHDVTDPPRDRNWQYLEFRRLDLPKLRDILMDEKALQVYKNDPFNPHAIARLRLSAYQKCIVMKYIDNLLDWGDSLFSTFTMESVNEATLLYIVAADILGERLVALGECGEGTITPKTYEKIGPLVKQPGSEILAEMESLKAASSGAGKMTISPQYMLEIAHVLKYSNDPPVGLANPSANPGDSDQAMSPGLFKGYGWKKTFTSSWSSKPEVFPAVNYDAPTVQDTGGSWASKHGAAFQMVDYRSPLLTDFAYIPDFGWSLLRQIGGPVFCVPHNKDLLEYWDRVEDRLYKIRHCMDIKGVRRQLALFAPEIDPRLLVRAKALGLSIEDVLDSISGNLPPYRFTYLIEKAKQYASTVQSFGAALLSAIEKREVEQLNQLKTVHEQNIQRLTTQMKQWEIDAEQEAIAALEKQQEAIQYRRDYYQGLIDEGLMPWERTQQVTQHMATASYIMADILSGQAGVLYLLPQVGSPFAMKYGGQEFGNSIKEWATVFRDTGRVAETMTKSAGLEAQFERREKEWEHQVKLADHELKEIEKKLAGAEIRKKIVEKSLELHKKTIQQTEEVYDFYKNKFSNFGLYTWLSTDLQRLYRDAYNSAYAMARLAEQAFRFERGDSSGILLGGNYWDASKAGLLAGERLLLDLQNMERRFVETNYRTLEIEQSFSLAQIDPQALVNLREQGSCQFTIPEFYFDLFYPGQYRRKIKAARITIPCVTGPYINVSATLTLTGSQVRNEPKIDAELKDVPLTRTVSIATSKAQNDAGVFEFSFRDERYMPFEGAGAANSQWSLALPKNFRQFDYGTISDVVLHLSYTAEEDGAFREKVEQVNGTLQGALLDYLLIAKGDQQRKPLRQLLSLRHDFSSAFHKLVRSPVNTPVDIEITDTHFPIFFKFLPNYQIHVQEAWLILKRKPDLAIGDFTVSINGLGQTGFAKESKFGDLFAKRLADPAKQPKDAVDILGVNIQTKHTLKIVNAGTLAPTAPAPGTVAAIDASKLGDILLYLEYGIEEKQKV